MMRPSVQGVDPPVCCVLDVTVTYARDSFVDCPAGPFVLSRGGGGGPRSPGTRLTVPSSGTVLGHSQGSLQCHFSRCKVGSLKGLRVRIVLVDAFTDLMRCRK